MSGRPWIKHDGCGCPFPKGTRLDVERRGGFINVGIVIGSGKVGHDGYPTGEPANGLGGSTWEHGSTAPTYRYLEVMRYRFPDTDDKVKREARMAEFTRIADEGLKTDVPVKSPQKVGAGQ